MSRNKGPALPTPFLFLLLLFLLLPINSLVTDYQFKRVCQTCSSCSGSKYGNNCFVNKGGPYDGQSWEVMQSCTDDAYCKRYYPMVMKISNSTSCYPISTSCLRTEIFADNTTVRWCSLDPNLCNYDPNAIPASTLTIIYIVVGVSVALIIVVVAYCCWKKNKNKQRNANVNNQNQGQAGTGYYRVD